ncbi:MAG: hypothetical protein PSY12_14140 [bacterium]|nr:hypothetical protein [bacterium]
MGEDLRRRDDRPADDSLRQKSRGNGVIFGLLALALILAIGFFYMTNERLEDRQADAITRAAGSMDDAAKVVGDAAKDAAGKLRNGH